MSSSLIIMYRGIYLLFAISFFGCFSLTDLSKADSDSPPKQNVYADSDSDSDSINNQNNRITVIEQEIYSMRNTLKQTSHNINIMRDSLKTFQQLNISGDTSDKDIINSLIRIQTKLNIIEEKIFYSDSIYFNLLNDLVIIETQIQELDDNIDSIINLNAIIDEDDNVEISPVETYQSSYEDNYSLGREYYKNEDYDKSSKIFNDLVYLDSSNVLADNSQFWIAEVYYLKGDYKTAIEEYNKVSGLGDNNKTPYAEYKIAMCYFYLNDIEISKIKLEDIIIRYPELASKSQKFINGNLTK